ncbi:hypothetical protein K470DRAFT_267762 [Piedraia hortae CBS 480.64]|uniref:Uncharacterized protein n=1 Tax=Piedraia hortae CBS 480.64 TaxID=1314780 RepID=A0A6A7C8A4_9PEZI|nr:hypothetical protein K470DRAFT_267762 [Piedraia hortae CBS 480.64]
MDTQDDNKPYDLDAVIFNLVKLGDARLAEYLHSWIREPEGYQVGNVGADGGMESGGEEVYGGGLEGIGFRGIEYEPGGQGDKGMTTAAQDDELFEKMFGRKAALERKRDAKRLDGGRGAEGGKAVGEKVAVGQSARGKPAEGRQAVGRPAGEKPAGEKPAVKPPKVKKKRVQPESEEEDEESKTSLAKRAKVEKKTSYLDEILGKRKR